VIVGSPEPGTVYTKTVTQFTTSGTVSTTVTNYPTATQGTATVVAVVPAASQDACGNQGTQWAFWNNTQGTNSLNGYTQFDPTVYKTQTPFYNATTGAAGGINQGTTSALISIYGSPKEFNSTFFTVGQKVSLSFLIALDLADMSDRDTSSPRRLAATISQLLVLMISR